MNRLRCSLVAVAAVSLSLVAVPVAGAAGTELLVNGSFEAGFSGWTTTQMANPLTPWTAATSANSGYFRQASPQHGVRDALNGFDGSAGAFTLTQQVTIPAGVKAALSWKDRIMYAMFGGAQARTVQVRILSTSNALLGTVYNFSTGPGDNTCCSVPPGHDNGWQSHSADLSSFAGQTVRVQFHFNIPQDFTGPGQAELDIISLIAEQLDADGDGVLDAADNCPSVANPDQANNDKDAQGDACDADDDNDGVADAGDNCHFTANTDQANNDKDAQGDACDADDDNDGVADAGDNCHFTANTDQANNDKDAQGDACDADDDNDGVADDAPDNCQFVPNPDQADADGDGKGTACDSVELPSDKEQCKKDGWRKFHDGAARFKNQGDCVSFVATGGRNLPAGS